MLSRTIVGIALSIIFLSLVGCSKGSEDISQPIQGSNEGFFYYNQELGIQIAEAADWVLEKETSNSVKFTSEKSIGLLSVVSKEKSVAEIKKELLGGAGDVMVIGEGLNFIAWKSERQESIRTEVWVEEKGDRYVIITLMTPEKHYEEKKEKLETFRHNIKIETKERTRG